MLVICFWLALCLGVVNCEPQDLCKVCSCTPDYADCSSRQLKEFPTHPQDLEFKRIDASSNSLTYDGLIDVIPDHYPELLILDLTNNTQILCKPKFLGQTRVFTDCFEPVMTSTITPKTTETTSPSTTVTTTRTSPETSTKMTTQTDTTTQITQTSTSTAPESTTLKPTDIPHSHTDAIFTIEILQTLFLFMFFISLSVFLGVKVRVYLNRRGLRVTFAGTSPMSSIQSPPHQSNSEDIPLEELPRSIFNPAFGFDSSSSSENTTSTPLLKAKPKHYSTPEKYTLPRPKKEQGGALLKRQFRKQQEQQETMRRAQTETDAKHDLWMSLERDTAVELEFIGSRLEFQQPSSPIVSEMVEIDITTHDETEQAPPSPKLFHSFNDETEQAPPSPKLFHSFNESL